MAQIFVATYDRQTSLQPNGFQQVGVDAATALTVPAGTRVAVVCPSVQACRFRSDATNPTAAIGVLLSVGDSLYVDSASIVAALKFISVVAGCLLNVEYYK